MRATVRADLTWDGVGKDFAKSSDKRLAKVLKEMTGANSVDIINRNFWEDDESEYEDDE